MEGGRLYSMDDLLRRFKNERERSGGSAPDEDEDPTVTPAGDGLTTPPTTDADSQGMDYPQVKILLESAKTGDLKILKKTAEAVKEFLLSATDKKTRVKNLMSSEDILPFLVKCLKATSDCAFFQQSAAWTLNVILETSKDTHVGKIGESEIGPLLVKCLASSDLDVLKTVTSTLNSLAFYGDSGFRSKLDSWNILDALTKLLKKNQSLNEEILMNVDKLVGNLTVANVRELFSRPGVDRMSLEPPKSVIMKAIPAILLLLDTNNDAIRRRMLCSICSLLVALDEIGPFVSHGFCPKLASYCATYSEEVVLVGVTTALGTIATMGVDSVLGFLRAVEAKDGLKDIWKCLGMKATTQNLDNDRAVCNFLEALDAIVYKDRLQNEADTNTVIQSGLVDGLALALKKDSCYLKFKNFCMSILGGLCFYDENLPKARQQVIANLGILREVIGYLESDNPSAADGAATVIAMLLDGSAERREEALNLGVLPILLKIAQRKATSWEYIYPRGGENVVSPVNNQIVIHSSIKALQNIVKVEPRPPVSTLRRILKAILKCLISNGGATGDNADIKFQSILCIAEFVESDEGRALVFEKQNNVKKLLDFLGKDDEPALQLAALQLTCKIFQHGDPQNRKSVLEMGVLQHFDKLIKCDHVIVRRGAYNCLFLIMNGELTNAQRATIDKLIQFADRSFKERYGQDMMDVVRDMIRDG